MKFNEQEKFYGVEGWLKLFCIILTIISPLLTLSSLSQYHRELSPLFSKMPQFQTLFKIDATLSVILIVVSIYTGITLWKIYANAIRMVKIYFITYIILNLTFIFVPFIINLPSQLSQSLFNSLIPSFIRSCIFVAVWWLYFLYSKRVKATYRENLYVIL